MCPSLRDRGGARCGAARTPAEVVCLSLHGRRGALWRGAASVARARTSIRAWAGTLHVQEKKTGVTGVEARWAGGAYAFGLSATTKCVPFAAAQLFGYTSHFGPLYFIIGWGESPTEAV